VIALLGATGRIGRHVAAGLAAAGADARALVRDPAPAALPVPAMHADLSRPATLTAALDGAQRLLLVTLHGPDQDLLEAAAIDAAVAAGVRHVVKISGGAATLGPSGTTPTAVAHWRSEQRIERAGLHFDFLRPSFFMQNLLATIAPTVAKTGVLAAPFGHAPIAMVDLRDVAACAVAALLDPEPGRRAWQLTGPRAVTLDAIAADLAVRHMPIPAGAAARALARSGASAWEIDHSLRMAAFLAARSDAVVTDHVARLTGNPPRTIEAFLDEHRDRFTPATALARFLSRPSHKKAA
jgi:NAD(P)H dehydrogenase (quinone)